VLLAAFSVWHEPQKTPGREKSALPRAGFPCTDGAPEAPAANTAAAASAAGETALLGAIGRQTSVVHVAPPSVRLALVLASAAAVLPGCGSSGDPLAQVKDAAKKTFAVSAATYTFTLDRPTLFGPEVDSVGGRAAYDFTAGEGYEALTLHTRKGEKRTLYLDYLPAAVYVAPWPTPAGLLPPGKIWIALDFAGAAATANKPLAREAEELGAELPLAEIAWGASSASHLGTRVVRHIPMEAYRVSVDLPEALAAAKRNRRVALAAAIERQRDATPSRRLEYEVLVTGAGHVARIDAKIAGSRAGAASFAFSSFHAEFNRNPPRRSQSVPLASITEPRFLWTIAARS